MARFRVVALLVMLLAAHVCSAAIGKRGTRHVAPAMDDLGGGGAGSARGRFWIDEPAHEEDADVIQAAGVRNEPRPDDGTQAARRRQKRTPRREKERRDAQDGSEWRRLEEKVVPSKATAANRTLPRPARAPRYNWWKWW
jgi:hypothetical protein